MRPRSASRCRPSGVIPAHQKVNFGFGKVDYQVGCRARWSRGRYLFFKNLSPSNIAGNTRRSPRPTGRPTSPTAWIRRRCRRSTTIGNSRLNEFRLQFARRHQFRTLATSAVRRAGDHRERRRGVRRPAHRRRQLGRVRLHSENLAGRSTTTPGCAARTRSRPVRTSSTSATSASRRRTVPLHVPDDCRLLARARAGTAPYGYVDPPAERSATW